MQNHWKYFRYLWKAKCAVTLDCVELQIYCSQQNSSYNRVDCKILLCLLCHHYLMMQWSNLCNVAMHKTLNVLCIFSSSLQCRAPTTGQAVHRTGETSAFLAWTPTLHPAKLEVRVINCKVSQCKGWDNRRTSYHLRLTSWLTAWLLQHSGNFNSKMNLPLAGWNCCRLMHSVWASTRSHCLSFYSKCEEIFTKDLFHPSKIQMKSERKNNNPPASAQQDIPPFLWQPYMSSCCSDVQKLDEGGAVRIPPQNYLKASQHGREIGILYFWKKLPGQMGERSSLCCSFCIWNAGENMLPNSSQQLHTPASQIYTQQQWTSATGFLCCGIDKICNSLG